MKHEWIKQELDRREDDLLIDSFSGWELYAIAEQGISGYGVYKNGEYWATWESISGKSHLEASQINTEQYKEALRFGHGLSDGQLAIFEV